MIRVLRDRFTGDGRRAARALIRRALGPVVLTDDDKPKIVGGPELSISHAGDCVVIALADRPVGIDVEPVDHRRDVDAICAAALGDDYALLLSMLPPERRPDRFTSWWVRAEALCKATGAGLMFPVETSVPGYSIRDVAMPAGYRAAIAWSNP